MEVNRFDKSSGLWKHGNFKIDKFSTFHGCKINFLILDGWPQFFAEEIDYKKRDVTKCLGYLCEMLKTFNSTTNYTYHMNTRTMTEDRQFETRFPEMRHDLLLRAVALNENLMSDK